MSDKQQPQQGQKVRACPHPEAVGTRWGDPITQERQQELQGNLDQWAQEQDHRERKGPFDRTGLSDEERNKCLQLTGGAVSWLVEQSGRDSIGFVPDLHLETLYVNAWLWGE